MKNRELRMKLLALGMAGAMTISLCGCGTETTEDNGDRSGGSGCYRAADPDVRRKLCRQHGS